MAKQWNYDNFKETDDTMNNNYTDYDNYDNVYENSKMKNMKYKNSDSNGKKPQWRADRKEAKKFKQQLHEMTD